VSAATELPEDIYRCIQAFTSINALLNTSRRLADVKRRLFCWNLNPQHSLLYYCSAEYRSLLSETLLAYGGSRQVTLDLRLGLSLNNAALAGLTSSSTLSITLR
jgi:hypothetical protein